MNNIPPEDDFNENELFNVVPDRLANMPDARNLPPKNLPMPPPPVKRNRMAQPVQDPSPPTPQMMGHHSRNPHLGHRQTPQTYGSVLEKYYRIPGPHLKLATNGMFMPIGSVDFTANGDIPVFPMKASDEMLLKSPDALMSGLALEKLFESCVPAIKHPRMISTPDIDVLLIGIRVATYGDNMAISAPCPKCKHENTFDCNLPSLIGTMRYVDSDGSVQLSNEVMAYVRPYNLDNATKLALIAFEETRRLQALENTEMDGQQRALEVNKTMSRIDSVNKNILVDCVYKIVVEEGEVIDKNEIQNFVANIPKPWVEKLDATIKKLNDSGINKKLHVVCESCNEEWDTEVEFDPSNFFEGPSSE